MVGSFAVSAALALAPLESADDELTPMSTAGFHRWTLFSWTKPALQASPTTDYYVPVDAFDIMKTTDPAQDAPATVSFSALDYGIFAVNPAFAGVPAEAGSYDVFNGALTEFYDAYHVELYSWLNPNVDITPIPSDDLFGASPQATDAVLALGNASLAADAFLTDGWNDLLGYFGVISI